MGTSRQRETTRFECSRLGGTAVIHLTYLSFEGTGRRTVTGSECESCDHYGVGVTSNGGLAHYYDWAKCVHPQLKTY